MRKPIISTPQLKWENPFIHFSHISCMPLNIINTVTNEEFDALWQVGPSTFFSSKQFEVFDVELLNVQNCQRRTIVFYSDVVCDWTLISLLFVLYLLISPDYYILCNHPVSNFVFSYISTGKKKKFFSFWPIICMRNFNAWLHSYS